MNDSPTWRGTLLALLLLAGGFPLTEAHGQTEIANDPAAVACGQTVTGRLEVGESQTFTFDALPGEVLALEAVDVSGGGELLQLRVAGPGLRLNTCTGRIEPSTSRPTAPLEGGTYSLRIADCFGDAAVEYAVTVNLLSDSRRNCGRLLACGGSRDSELATPGAVDAVRFSANLGDNVVLGFENSLDSRGGLEVRFFDPDGEPVRTNDGNVSSCRPLRRFVAEKRGVYTALVNACFGYGTGTFRASLGSDACSPVALRGAHSGNGPMEIGVTPDGSQVAYFGARDLSCAFADVPAFLSDFAIPIEERRFSHRFVVGERADRDYRIDVDGVLDDVDADGNPDQALGGISIVTRDAGCNFRWVATGLPDQDGDAWSDQLEIQLDSDPRRANSTPESSEVPTTDLYGPDVCADFVDNDRDGARDHADSACRATTPIDRQTPSTYAGRHSGGSAFWVERDETGSVSVLVAVGVACGDATVPILRVPVEAAVTRGRWSASGRAADGSAPVGRWVVDVEGAFFDADDDRVSEQLVGALVLRDGNARCVVRFNATAFLDSDNDGWSDPAELRLGSDPLPMPSGQGDESMPEHRLVPVENGVDVCRDGIDNDGDGLSDGEEFPDCPRLAVDCAGDCDGGGDVTVDEILALVAESLGGEALCPAGDRDASGSITVDEIIAAVNAALRGCAA